jgi:hypothetical protein
MISGSPEDLSRLGLLCYQINCRGVRMGVERTRQRASLGGRLRFRVVLDA